jgi:pimeloyl-ACP methyl ester carboxylesterase
MLQRNVVEDRARRTPEQVAFWEHAHGADWEQVIDADTEMIRRFVTRGGDWFGGRLGKISCPVLLTASKQDPFLPNAGTQLCRMAEQIPNCRAYLHNEGEHPLMWSCSRDFRAISDTFLRALDG